MKDDEQEKAREQRHRVHREHEEEKVDKKWSMLEKTRMQKIIRRKKDIRGLT